MGWPSVIVIVIVAPAMWACASATVPLAELRAYEGVYALSGAGPPDRIPLNGTVTIADGGYVLDTSLGTCKKRPLKVPKPRFTTVRYETIQDATDFVCGDLNMRVVLSNGRVSGVGAGYYWSEKRVALAPVCVAMPSDSAGRARGDCARWRTDYDDQLTERSYHIRIERKF